MHENKMQNVEVHEMQFGSIAQWENNRKSEIMKRNEITVIVLPNIL
jgi:hypothetical protein